MIALAAVGLAGFAYLAWSAIGWFGVGMLGLLVLFIALRVELEGDRPVGTQTTPELYANHFHAERAQNPAERTGRRAQVATFTASASLFTYAGALLAVIGFGLVYLGWGRSGLPELFYLFGGTLWNSFQRGRPW